MSPVTVSKSKYLAGLQCSKLLWHHVNAKETIPKPDRRTLSAYDRGHQIGNVAKTLFTGGIEVAAGVLDIDRVTAVSRELLPLRQPLFEAGFKSKNTFARADVLEPVGDDGWNLVEVKALEQPKAVNLLDLAFQYHVYRGAGLMIKRCSIMHLAPGNRGSRNQELARLDVTRLVLALHPGVASNVRRMTTCIARKQPPEVA